MAKTKIWAVAEVATIFLLVMIAIWFFQQNPIPFAATIIAILVVITFSIISRMRAVRLSDYAEEIGLGRWKPTWPYWKLDFSWAGKLALLTILSVILILIAGCFLKPEFWLKKSLVRRIPLKLLWYCGWGFIQQLVLQGYVTNKIYSMFTTDEPLNFNRRAAVWTAVVSGILFFCAHIPNPKLMIITPIAGAATAYIFLRCRNVLVLGIAHGILGTAITYCLPFSMRVGPHFWQ